VRFLTQEELVAVIDRGVTESKWAVVDRPLYLVAAMTGLRQEELLALRFIDLDLERSRCVCDRPTCEANSRRRNRDEASAASHSRIA
jgi:integrase